MAYGNFLVWQRCCCSFFTLGIGMRCMLYEHQGALTFWRFPIAIAALILYSEESFRSVYGLLSCVGSGSWNLASLVEVLSLPSRTVES